MYPETVIIETIYNAPRPRSYRLRRAPGRLSTGVRARARKALGLPRASDFLQIPDQTFDLPVKLAPGSYYFQCDPLAALGMTGRLKVDR
jgi:hypothetical protein